MLCGIVYCSSRDENGMCMEDPANDLQSWWDPARFDEAALKTLEQELRVIAAARLRAESTSSLSTGDLVNEAILRLSAIVEVKWTDRPHLLAMASTLMKRILIDHARRRGAMKRDHQKVTLVTGLAEQEPALEIMALDFALKDLRALDAQRADVVEMRFFGGMSSTDIGEVLGISEATVKRRWTAARAWLYDRLKQQS